jgi:hypothetical protein
MSKILQTLARLILLLVFALGLHVIIQAQVLKPSPVPETPAPPTPPTPSTPSNIDFPVSAPAPDLGVVEDYVCEWVGGITDDIVIGPINLGKFNYEVWRRKPLDELRLHDSQFSMSAYVYYWADNGWIGCGWDDEPARQVIIGLDSKIKWGAKWNLESYSKIRPFAPQNRCQVSGASYDVTDLLVKYGQPLAEKGASKFDADLRAKSNYRARASQVWQDLQEPKDMGDGTWFLLQPQAVAAGPITFSSTTPQTIDSVFSLTADPIAVVGDKPTPTTNPLPDIQVIPDPQGFHIIADVGITFEEISRLLQNPSTGLVGKKYVHNRRELTIVGARMYGSGEKAAIELLIQAKAIPAKRPKIVDVATFFVNVYRRIQYAFEKHFYKLSGTIYLTADPKSAAAQQEVGVANSQYDADTLRQINKKAKWILQTSLIESVNNDVRAPIGDKLNGLRGRVFSILNRPVGSYADMSGQINSLNIQKAFVGDKSIKARVAVDGTGRLVVRW